MNNEIYIEALPRRVFNLFNFFHGIFALLMIEMLITMFLFPGIYKWPTWSLVLIVFISIYILSFFLIKSVRFTENTIIFFYPTQFIYRKIIIKYEDIARVNFGEGSFGAPPCFTIIRREKKIYRHFFYYNKSKKKTIEIMKLFKKHDIFIKINSPYNYNLTDSKCSV